MSEAGLIKRHLDWVSAETITRGLRIPWSPYVVQKLLVCQQVIKDQEDKRIEMIVAKAKK